MSKVKIGPLDYDVFFRYQLKAPDGDPSFGFLTDDSVRIGIDTESVPIIRYRSLWHEMLHGILLNAGYTSQENSTDEVERMIRVLATGIIDILIENPDVRSFSSFEEFIDEGSEDQE